MRFKFLMLASVLMFQLAVAQTPPPASYTVSESAATNTTPAATDPATPLPPRGASNATQTTYLDYKSVYEAATIEEEVKMAAERFSLTPEQQDIWFQAATNRRAVEKQAKEKLESKSANYEKDGAYKGLRTAHNNFHDIIIGHLTPAQKNAMETDRLILQEKQKRVAMLPPPPPPAPTVTATPIDSTAIKAEAAKGKKAKKKKKG